MADKKQETIVDIVAEMRRNFADGNPYFAAGLPDRLEAAHKREIEATAAKCCQLGRLAGYGASEIKHQQEPVGNAAKLREALVSVQKKIHYLIGSLNVPNSLVANRMEINGIINAALAAPPRNCDKYATVKEAIEAFARERQDMPHPCPDFTFSRWLLTPVKKEGGAK